MRSQSGKICHLDATSTAKPGSSAPATAPARMHIGLDGPSCLPAHPEPSWGFINSCFALGSAGRMKRGPAAHTRAKMHLTWGGVNKEAKSATDTQKKYKNMVKASEMSQLFICNLQNVTADFQKAE